MRGIVSLISALHEASALHPEVRFGHPKKRESEEAVSSVFMVPATTSRTSSEMGRKLEGVHRRSFPK